MAADCSKGKGWQTLLKKGWMTGQVRVNGLIRAVVHVRRLTCGQDQNLDVQQTFRRPSMLQDKHKKVVSKKGGPSGSESSSSGVCVSLNPDINV